MTRESHTDQPSDDPSGLATTRADQPIETINNPEGIESLLRNPEAMHQAEIAHEAEIESGRKQIGVTRGDQPIERIAPEH